MNKSYLARGVKANAIRQILQGSPQKKNREVVAILAAQGINCIPQDVANQRARNKRLGKESTALSLDVLLKVKNTVKAAGGYKVVQQKMAEVDQLAQKVGGLEKLRKGLEVLPEFQR